MQSVDGVRLLTYAQIDSTNAEALRRFQAGERERLWISAELQTAGRGRRSRQWLSPSGNLHATLMLPFAADQPALHHLPFIAALAAHDAVCGLLPALAPRLSLKWPNDLLLDGSKLAGLLLESARNGDGETGVAIGFGINCAFAPDVALYRTISLAQAGMPVAPGALLDQLAASMHARMEQWRCGAGFASIRQAWLDRAAGVGETIIVRYSDHEIEGRFAGLDDQGFLLLEAPSGATERISAADIFLKTAPQARA